MAYDPSHEGENICSIRSFITNILLLVANNDDGYGSTTEAKGSTHTEDTVLI